MAEPIDVGILPVVSAHPDEFTRALQQWSQDASPRLDAATGRTWRLHVAPANLTRRSEPRSPSEFLEEAALHMVEGPYDIVVVVTDQPLTGRRRVAAGLASSVARVAVLSAWKLQVGPRGEPQRPLDSAAVRWNAASLLVHLIGHCFGLPASTGAMAPWQFEAERAHVTPFDPRSERHLRRALRRVPEPTAQTSNSLGLFWFHLRSAARHPRILWRPLARSRAPLLPLSMPKLSTAALLPVLVLVFTAEIWDVGINMGDGTAIALAGASVVAAAAYILFVTDILFPRKERRLMSEHLAAVNAAVAVTMLGAMLGLLVMLWLLVMGVALFVFPEGLIRTWPTLGGPDVNNIDKMRLALFVASIGTLTGALGAGLESRTVLRHLALFREEV